MTLLLRRATAKVFDFAVMDVLLTPLVSYLSGIQLFALVCVLFLLYTPLLCGLIGTTPGKYIMGIRLFSESMGQIQLTKREALIFVLGFALLVPVMSLVALVLNIVDFRCKGSFIWDRLSDFHVSYDERSDATIYVLAALAMSVGYTSVFLLPS